MSLEQDFTTVPGQLFACLSIVGPECPQKNEKFGIKIRGCFSTRDEAANHYSFHPTMRRLMTYTIPTTSLKSL